MTKRCLAVALLCTVTYHTSANADAFSPTHGRWLLNLGVSYGNHSSSEADLTRSLNNAGALLSDYDNTNTGLNFGLLYQWKPQWLFSAGFRQFGDLENEWQIDSNNPQQDIKGVNRAMPTMGGGFYLGAGYRYSFTTPVFAQLVLDAQYWQQNYTTTSSGFDRISTKRDGIDPALTLGFGYRINSSMNLSLNLQRLQFDDDISNQVSLQFDWNLSESLGLLMQG